MIRQQYRVAGEPVEINTLESEADLPEMREWFARHSGAPIACDTEGTGLNQYASDFEIRLVQFGDGRTAWVLPVDRFRKTVEAILAHPGYRFVFHNALYDLVAFHAVGMADALAVSDRVEDTKIAAHMHDPRKLGEGGIGMGLKGNTSHYVDSGAPDTQDDLKAVFKNLVRTNDGQVHDVSGLDTKARTTYRKGLRERGLDPQTVKMEDGWRMIPLTHPTYTLYAGLDVIYTSRLYETLVPPLHNRHGLGELYRFEHEVMRECLAMVLRGIPVDVEYLEKLKHTMIDEEAGYLETIQTYGIASANSTAPLAEKFLTMGEELTAKTPKGAWKVDADVLHRLADVDKRSGERLHLRDPNPLASVVLEAKQVRKWRTTYVDRLLETRDENDVVHPNLDTLKARTGRMAAGIFQTFPGSAARIRNGLGGRDGWQFFSADYDQIEYRVAGAFAQEPKMVDAAKQGISQHHVTAEAVFGAGYTPAEYKAAKAVNFLNLYGGGAGKLSTAIGVSFERAQQINADLRDGLPQLAQFKRDLQAQVLEDALSAEDLKRYLDLRKRMFDTEDEDTRDACRKAMRRICWGKVALVTTPLGRKIPVEADEAYKATNYLVQSTSRDILATALLRLGCSGVRDYVLLPVHDEVVGMAPNDIATEVATAVGEIMTTTFRDVPITAEGKVYGPRWGDGYAQ